LVFSAHYPSTVTHPNTPEGWPEATGTLVIFVSLRYLKRHAI
jgi:hypothetical protein